MRKSPLPGEPKPLKHLLHPRPYCQRSPTLSRLNTQGFRVNVGYNLTDWLKAEVWYYGAWNLDKNVRLLSTGAASTNNAFYDANAAQNLIVQLTSSF